MATIINRTRWSIKLYLTFYSSEQEANPDSITKCPQFLKIYIKKIELHNPVGIGGVRLLGRKKKTTREKEASC